MTPLEPKNPRVIFLEDHKRIETLLERVIAAVRADDREAAQKRWKRLEDAVLRHLDVEEMYVFPMLREVRRAEVDRLRQEHDEFRRQLGAIALSLELHTARCEPIEAFCAALHEHAEREDSLAYVQAERTLPVSVARSIAARIKVGLAALRKARSRPTEPASSL